MSEFDLLLPQRVYVGSTLWGDSVCWLTFGTIVLTSPLLASSSLYYMLSKNSGINSDHIY